MAQPRLTFVDLPVADVAASKRFFDDLDRREATWMSPEAVEQGLADMAQAPV